MNMEDSMKYNLNLVLHGIKVVLFTGLFSFVYVLIIGCINKIFLFYSISIEEEITQLFISLLKLNKESAFSVFYVLIVIPGLVVWTKIMNKIK